MVTFLGESEESSGGDVRLHSLGLAAHFSNDGVLGVILTIITRHALLLSGCCSLYLTA